MSDSENESGFKYGTDDYWEYHNETARLAAKINMHPFAPDIGQIILDEAQKATSLPAKRALATIVQTNTQLQELREAERRAQHTNTSASLKKDREARTRSVPMQGGIRRSSQGLHTPTMEEIIQKANEPDPTAPYFDPNSDHMEMIDPLAPHYDLSGDFPTLVNPLAPHLKMPSNG